MNSVTKHGRRLVLWEGRKPSIHSSAPHYSSIQRHAVYTIKHGIPQRMLMYSSPSGPASPSPPRPKKIGLNELREKFESRVPIVMVTAYDILTSRCAHMAGVDVILVGDSLGMVVFGEKGTNGVSIHDMVRHCRAVTNANHPAVTPFIVGDMPFGSYLTPEDAVRNACKLVRDGRVDAVKMEGGERIAPMIEAVIKAGMPVMGHTGLTPQTASAQGGMVTQGRTARDAAHIYASAKCLESLGCFSVVLEALPHRVATHITNSLTIPTIGIGAGPGCSGQVQVFHDIAGMFHSFVPKFAKRFALVGRQMEAAVESYRDEVVSGMFPMKQHSFAISNIQYEKYLQLVDPSRVQSGTPDEPIKKTAEINNVAGLGKDQKEKLRIAVIGAGAMGSLVAGNLSKAGFNVTLITQWEDHLQAINQKGLLVKTMADDGKVLGDVIKVNMCTPQTIAKFTSGGPADVIFILTKGHSTRKAARTANTILSPSSLVVTLQNGMGHAARIQEEVKDARVIEGTISHGALLEGPGCVCHTGRGPVVIGAGNGNKFISQNCLALVSSVLNDAGFETTLADSPTDLTLYQWRKLGVNIVVNPLTALLGIKNGALIGNPDVHDLAKSLISEFNALAAARGIEVPDVLSVMYDVANRTKHNTSSMLSDIQRGVQTEIEFLNGFIVREGRRLGVDVSSNETVLKLVKALESFKKLESLHTSADESSLDPKQTVLATSIDQLRIMTCLRRKGCKVGFVPTMGGLHEGHLHLVRRAKAECDFVIVSIYVNPLQFAPHEDFDAYPRDQNRDFEMLQAEEVDLVFAPDSRELFPSPLTARVVMEKSDEKAEGRDRPHFFHGVATIVLKLLNIVQPTLAYFGQKDAQQCSVIRNLVHDLNVPCQIRVCDTMREKDGLAMSTRNQYLSPEERKAAPVLYKSLLAARSAFDKGQLDVSQLKTVISSILQSEPMFRVSYISFSDNWSMEEVTDLAPSLATDGVCISIAGTIGTTRLIDNIVLRKK